uniref:Uncharacterized protein n=1 Tax=Euplotes harpa TaxID=151035 RepID=A0A7S3NGL0_9SPIT
MNIGSQFGRMSYTTYMLLNPAAFMLYVFAYKPYKAYKKKQQDQKEWDEMPPAKKVDKDIFNPFTPIPYHNNRELKYGFDHINMFGFVNKNHINVKSYPWKQFHDSFAESESIEYQYNWTSTSSDKH